MVWYLPNTSWCDQSTTPLTAIKLCKIHSHASSSKQPLFITHCLSVDDNLRWSLFVHNHQVQRDTCPALASIPTQLTAESFASLLSTIDRLHVCAGHPDPHFVSMVSAKKGVLKSSTGAASAILDDYAPIVLNGEYFTETVRTSGCELILNDVKCQSCKAYRATLRVMYSRWSSRDSSTISKTTSRVIERYLNTPEKKAKMENMKK